MAANQGLSGSLCATVVLSCVYKLYAPGLFAMPFCKLLHAEGTFSLTCLRPAEWWPCDVFCGVLASFAADSQLLGVCKMPY